MQSLSRLSLISHRSFILFHASGIPVQSYLLTIKQNTRYPLSLPSIFILHSFLCRLAYRVSHVRSISRKFYRLLQISPLVYTFFLHHKVSFDIIFFTYFFRIFFHDSYIHSLFLFLSSSVCFLFSSSSIRHSFIPPFLSFSLLLINNRSLFIRVP